MRILLLLSVLLASANAQPSCTCDVNNDGVVDLGDVGLIDSMFINSQASSCHAGPVSLDDIGRVVNGFLGNGCVPLNAVRFSQCQALTSGSWYLDTPVTAAVSSKCIDIENAANVTLQCAAGATISASAGSTPFPPLLVSNSTNVKVQSCTMRATGTTPTLPLAPVYVLNGSTVTLQDSGAVGGQSYGSSSTVTIHGGAYETWRVSDAATLNITGGTFTAVPGRGYVGAVIWADGSLMNIDGGVFDGGWSGTTNTTQAQALKDGVDDSIVLYFGKPGGSIKNATFRNAWDTHIENVGLVQNWDISNNKCYRWGISCIGGWYRSQWDNNRVVGNIAYASANAQNNAPGLFSFSYGPWSGITDAVVYFRNNLFSGNQWLPDSTVNSYVFPAWFDLTEATRDGAQLVVNGNVFADNDFRNSRNLPGYVTNLPIYGQMKPMGVMVDGGGNLGNLISWPNQADRPITFH